VRNSYKRGFTAQFLTTRILGAKTDLNMNPLSDRSGGAAPAGGTGTDARADPLGAAGSAALLRAISDASADVIFAKDREGRLLFANPATLALIGKPLAAVLGCTDLEFLEDKEAARKVMRNDQAIMQSGQPAELEEAVPLPDGTRRMWHSRKMPWRDESGQVIGLLGVSRDITDRKQAEEKLREADRRKDEFLATLAHELRNPLAPLRNGVAVLRMASADAGARRQVLEMMDRQVEHMVRLIDDLLDSSRLATGKLQLAQQRIELGAVVQGAVESARALFDARAINLDARLPAAPLAVLGDRIRLDQVVTNLLTNAAKFTPAGGTVSVALEQCGSRARVRVTDTGLGIPPGKLEAIFELFAQLHPPGSEHFQSGGLGIGLNLARRLVQLHGGTLSAASAVSSP
jgi:PAS domain S-box-containing protein